MSVLALYVLPLVVGAVFVVLVAGIWNMSRSGSPMRSQHLMRARVILQFLAILLIAAIVYFMRR
jgi:hypothetical protein